MTLDIINNTLGVEVVSMVGGRLVDGVFSPLLSKGIKVPATNTGPYSPASDNQTSVLLRCFEGESPVTQGNTLLDEILVDGLPPRPAGEVQIKVRFTKTVNDMLEVGWNVEGTPIQGNHTIHMRSGLHSPAEMEKRKKAMDDHMEGWAARNNSISATSSPPGAGLADVTHRPALPRTHRTCRERRVICRERLGTQRSGARAARAQDRRHRRGRRSG